MKKNEMDVIGQKNYMTPCIDVITLPLSEVLTESVERFDNTFEDDFLS